MGDSRKVRLGAGSMLERTPRGGTIKLAALLARLCGHVLVERFTARSVVDGMDVPPSVLALTTQWLTAVLCDSHDGVKVVGYQVDLASAGTSVRAVLRVQYDDLAPPGLPDKFFVKTTPSVRTRIANGATGTSAGEAGFYRELRSQLELEAPRGFHSAFSITSLRSIHLIEDLVSSKNATFFTPADVLSRSQAEDVVFQLARLHRSARALPRPQWLRPYQTWWEDGIRVADLKSFHDKGLRRSRHVVPTPLRKSDDRLWRAFVRSVEIHGQLPTTVLHGDPHLGNWYQTGDSAMGLLDWQCVTVGHWSRDLAYALSSVLTVDQRRAWERDLVALYVELLGDFDGEPDAGNHGFLRYRQQLPGALMMWTPVCGSPWFAPEMQPRSVALEMVHRISTAIDDLDACASLDA